MDAQLRSLIARREQAMSAMRAANDTADENGILSADACATIERAEASIDKYDAMIRRYEVDNALTTEPDPAKPNEPTITPEDAYTEAFEAMVRRGQVSDVLETGIRNDLGATGTDAAGGFLVPKTWQDQINKTIDIWSPIEAEANNWNTGTGETINWPGTDDTSNAAVIIGEGVDDTQQDVVFSNIGVGAWTYTSKYVPVSIQLLNDSIINVAETVGTLLGERLSRGHNTHTVNGTGASQPQGLVSGAPLAVTTASSTAFTADELLDLQHGVKPAYRPGSKFILSDAALKIVRKIKDNNQQYIFQSAKDGMGGTIHGSEYLVNDAVSAPTAGNFAVGFANIRAAYVVRRTGGVVAQRLNEIRALKRQAVFVAFDRFDGKITQPLACATLKMKP